MALWIFILRIDMAVYITSKKNKGVQYYKKKDGTKSFFVRYRDESNKPKRVKIGCETEGVDESYCTQKLIEILNAQNKGEQPPKIVKSRFKKIITLDIVADKYFSSKKNTISTHERLSKYNKHLSSVLGSHSIIHIKKIDLENIQKDIIEIKKLSEKTANMILELFSTIFNFGFKEDLYNEVNPATKVTRFKIQNTRERYLRKPEIEEFFSKTMEYDLKNNNGSFLELFTKLALTTGARTNAILHIKKKDIDLQSDIIRIIDFKRDGIVYSGYVTDTTRKLLEEHLKKLNFNDYVVSFNHSGDFTSIRQLQTKLKPILDKLFNIGLEKNDRKNRIVVHSLRHTFASQLAIADVPIIRIQELMNHADIRQTMKYAKLQDDENKKAAQGIF